MSSSDSLLPQGPLGSEALPLYTRVAGRLLDDIAANGARPGDRLPSERALADRYGVSRVTMRSALNELAERSVIESSPARGWFLAAGSAQVLSPPGDAAAPVGNRTVQGFADYAERHGFGVRAEVLDSRVRAATVRESERLRVGPGADLFEMRRVRFLDDRVVVLEHNRLPLGLCPGLTEADFTRDSLYATLRRADPPQLPRVADYSVEARQPTDEERELLEITDATPVLVATQLAFNQDAQPLELTVASYRGDRYHFRASITG
ncbi:UTRA domain-containing protein [Streptomyces sp. 3MP-14]|uniref:UTRA domain-containing protein n=1 Tax=Streptomyces mimosae TaxID=2586635 RepID=A0A5N5ZM84_9ACTN|nr:MULTISPECIES: GntR family transcriptional regulator [Streptomyces]KAB8157435.1 UTRA domain-containing protein [Streptomyces mimosae]KAB8172259.1 UTRA domain-containing protein [Streptomyces sp. 3MP-14]